MAIPLQLQLFDAFLGAQEGIHATILPDVFSSGGSVNLWIDKFGRAKRIRGYSRQNVSAITTNTGGSATLLRALFPYRANSAGAFTRRLFGTFQDGSNESEIWYSDNDGVTWTFVEDLGAGSANAITDYAQMGNTLIACNGVVAPRSFDGSTWGTAGGTQLGAPTAAVGAAGDLSGTFAWRLVPITDTGVRKIGSEASNIINLSNEKGSLTWTADADTSVVGYELYRTTGTGKVYYYTAYIDGRLTVAYTDNTSDATILDAATLETHGDPPPTGVYFAEPHKQRMWYFRTDAFPQAGWWSDPGDPDSVYTQNQLPFVDQETMGDVITGARGDFRGHLTVFQERSIWTVSGSGALIGTVVDWFRDKTNAQTGTVHHRTVARIPAGSRYVDQFGKNQITTGVTLAYFTPVPDIRLFDGDNDVVISHPVNASVASFNYSQRHKTFCIEDHERAEVAWVFPSTTSEPDTAVVWNYRWGVWYEREWGFASAAVVENVADSQIILVGSNSLATGGHCFQLWSGNTFDGTAFRAQWMTKTLYGVNEQSQPAITHVKRWRWGDFSFEVDQNVVLHVEWLPGHTADNTAALGNTSISPAADTLLSADGDTILTATGDTIAVSQSTAQGVAVLKDSQGKYLHDTGMRIRIYDTGVAGDWSLESFTLAYQILPGLGRRMP